MIQSQINFNVVLKRLFTVVDAHLKADIDLYQLKLKHLHNSHDHDHGHGQSGRLKTYLN